MQLEIWQKYQNTHLRPAKLQGGFGVPYMGSKSFLAYCPFNHDKFYQWARNAAKMGYRIFISEYDMPSDFSLVATKEHRSILSQTANNQVLEKLFTIK